MTELEAAYAHCETLVRDMDRDRWLASLFVAPRWRSHVLTLYAFSYEVARLREITSEPKIGEIRLQWWREAIEGERRSEAGANPVSQALLATIAQFELPRRALVDLIEARRFDLYDDPMPTLNDLEGYCGETCSSLFRLAAIVCADGADPGRRRGGRPRGLRVRDGRAAARLAVAQLARPVLSASRRSRSSWRARRSGRRRRVVARSCRRTGGIARPRAPPPV